MSLLSLFSKKQSETPPRAGTSARNSLSGKSKNRHSDSDQTNELNEPLVPEKKRARRRLIGAVVMVLAVVIGLPMVLDTEPEAVNKNLLIQIAPKSVLPKDETDNPPRASSEEKEAVNREAAKNTEMAASESKPESSKPASSEALKPRQDNLPAKNEAAKARSENVNESAKALAILNGAENRADSAKLTTTPTTESSKTTGTRIVIQIGAFATQGKVDELRGKLTAAGIQSFTQKVATGSGDKIRVRVGPFSDKESAEKVRMRLQKFGLGGSLIWLN